MCNSPVVHFPLRFVDFLLVHGFSQLGQNGRAFLDRILRQHQPFVSGDLVAEGFLVACEQPAQMELRLGIP